jgi:hypothetical protein
VSTGSIATMKTDLLHRSPAPDAAPRQDRLWDRFRARALAASLDRELAAGCPPGFSPALAIRAGEIVSSAERGELARRWANVLDQASRGPYPRSPRALRRGAVITAEEDLREMISALTSGLPIEVRGAAMASRLLTDGTGPLYNPRSVVQLGTAVRAATRQMSSCN